MAVELKSFDRLALFAGRIQPLIGFQVAMKTRSRGAAFFAFATPGHNPVLGTRATLGAWVPTGQVTNEALG